MQTRVRDDPSPYDGQALTLERVACLARLEGLGWCEIDRSLGDDAVTVFAQCRQLGWVQMCRNSDGSIAVGKKFGAVYGLSSTGREALAAYRSAIKSTAQSTPFPKASDAYMTLMRDWLAHTSPPEYCKIFSPATGGG